MEMLGESLVHGMQRGMLERSPVSPEPLEKSLM